MDLARLQCTTLLYVFAVSWGLAHAAPHPHDRPPAVSDTAPRPFAVVELFTSEG
jgi:hypothetical protein